MTGQPPPLFVMLFSAEAAATEQIPDSNSAAGASSPLIICFTACPYPISVNGVKEQGKLQGYLRQICSHGADFILSHNHLYGQDRGLHEAFQ